MVVIQATTDTWEPQLAFYDSKSEEVQMKSDFFLNQNDRLKLVSLMKRIAKTKIKKTLRGVIGNL